jgi:hypothetical protein
VLQELYQALSKINKVEAYLLKEENYEKMIEKIK